MPVLTRSEYEKIKSDSPSLKTKEVKEPGESPVLSSDIKRNVFILQDVESRTFTDKIKLEGRDFERNVFSGKLKTTERILADFLISKGWILLDTIEQEA